MEAALQTRTDHDLLADYVLQGDEQAFADLVNRHLSLVYGLASREIYDFRLAEEISQNVFAALAQTARHRHPVGHISAWLYGTTRKQIALTMRKERRRKHREMEGAHSTISVVEDGTSTWKDLVPELNLTLVQLSPNDQKIIFLRYYEGLSLKELGESLAIKERAAQKRLHRAIERLRQLLRKRGVALTAGMLVSDMFTAGAASPPASLTVKVMASVLSQTAPVTGLGLTALHMVGVLLVGASVAIPTLVWQSARSSLPASSPSAVSVLGPRAARTALAIDDIEGIYQLALVEREPALSRLIQHLETPREQAYLRDLAQRWAGLDPERLARALVALYERCEDHAAYAIQLGESMALPISLWMKQDATAAQTWVLQLPRTSYAEAYAFEAVLAVHASSSPDIAWAWLIQRPFNRDRAFEILVSQVTLEWLRELAPDQGFDALRSAETGLPASQPADFSRSKLWEHGAAHFYAQDHQVVADWVTELPISKASTAALTAFASQWAHDESARAAAWALTLADAVRPAAVCAVADSWARQHPYQSLQWSLSIEDQPLRWAATETAFLGWTEDASVWQEASTWLHPLADEPAAEGLFRTLSQRVPAEEAARWATSLAQGSNRDLARDQSYFRLGKESSNKALSLLNELVPGEQVQAAEFLSLGWLVGGGKKALEAWQSSLPPDSALFFASMKATVDLMAAFDPERAGRVVGTLPAIAARDPLVVCLIERSVGRSPEFAMALTDKIIRNSLRESTRAYIEMTKDADFTALLPPIRDVPFAEQTLDQLQQRLDYVSKLPIRKEAD